MYAVALSQVKSLQHVTTRIGLARAFLRMTLADKSLEHCLETLANGRRLLRACYHEYAFLRSQVCLGVYALIRSVHVCVVRVSVCKNVR